MGEAGEETQRISVAEDLEGSGTPSAPYLGRESLYNSTGKVQTGFGFRAVFTVCIPQMNIKLTNN